MKSKLVLCSVFLAMICVPFYAAASGQQAEADDSIVTVSFQSWNPGQEPMDQMVIEDFAAKNPGMQMKHIYVPYADHIQKLKIDLASGQGPDVYGMQLGAVLTQFRDFEMPLSSYAEKSWGAGWQKKFLPFAMKMLNEDGEFYGMPLGMTYAGFIWADKVMLGKYGIDSAPDSLAKMTAAAKKLRAAGSYPLATGAKDDWINLDMWMNIANDLSPEKLYSAIEGKTPFTDARLVEAFGIWQSLFTDGIYQDGTLGVNMYNDTTDLFEKEGSIPMITNGSWAVGNYVSGDPQAYANFNDPGQSHEVFLMDWNNDGKPAPITGSIDVVLSMNKDSKHPDAAWAMIDYLVHDGQDILINQYCNYSPSRTDLVLDVQGMSAEGQANLSYIVEQSKVNVGGFRENPYPELKQALADNLKALAIGSVTPAEAAAAVQAASKAQER